MKKKKGSTHSIYTTPSNHHLVNKFITRIVYDSHVLAYTQSVLELELTLLSEQKEEQQAQSLYTTPLNITTRISPTPELYMMSMIFTRQTSPL
jgi:hypothetical protein